MTTKYDVGDSVLVEGLVDSIYIDSVDNEPIYHIHIKGAVGGEAYRIRVKDSAMRARQKGTCATCIHRDPEDKKCDCGAMERQGCPLTVSDDYFCKFYEKVTQNDKC